MNRFLLFYGNERKVAVYGCIGHIVSILSLLLQGVRNGSQSHISESYGKKDEREVRGYLHLTYKTAMVITVFCVIVVFLARGKIGMLFGASSEANQGVIQYLPYFLSKLFFLALVRITTSYFYATEKTMLSYVLVYAEPVSTLILPLLFGLNGMWMAVPATQFVTFCIAWSKRNI